MASSAASMAGLLGGLTAGLIGIGGGAIVNISSVGGRMAYPLGSLYHGSKWAVEGLSEAVHFELAMLGIRMKLVEPGAAAPFE